MGTADWRLRWRDAFPFLLEECLLFLLRFFLSVDEEEEDEEEDKEEDDSSYSEEGVEISMICLDD